MILKLDIQALRWHLITMCCHCTAKSQATWSSSQNSQKSWNKVHSPHHPCPHLSHLFDGCITCSCHTQYQQTKQDKARTSSTQLEFTKPQKPIHYTFLFQVSSPAKVIFVGIGVILSVCTFLYSHGPLSHLKSSRKYWSTCHSCQSRWAYRHLQSSDAWPSALPYTVVPPPQSTKNLYVYIGRPAMLF